MEGQKGFLVLAVVLALASGIVSNPVSNSLNSQQLQSNQLTSGDSNGYQQGGQGGQGINVKTTGGGDQTVGGYILRSNGNSPPSYYPATFTPANTNAYARESGSSSPFFGLSSNGEFQLSAYFSQIFWGFVALVVATALIIWLIRIFFPKDSFGGIVQKIKETGTAKSIDLDRLTNMVYGAIDNYGKSLFKDIRDSNNYGKTR